MVEGPHPAGAVPGPGIAVQRAEFRDHARTEGVQVEVAHQLQEVGLLLHHDGLVPVVEEVPDPVVPAIERACVARQEGPHTARKGPLARPDEEVRVVREEGPGVDGEGPRLRQRAEPGDEVGAVDVIREDGAALEPPHHDVMEGIGRVEPSLPWHGKANLAQSAKHGNVP